MGRRALDPRDRAARRRPARGARRHAQRHRWARPRAGGGPRDPGVDRGGAGAGGRHRRPGPARTRRRRDVLLLRRPRQRPRRPHRAGRGRRVGGGRAARRARHRRRLGAAVDDAPALPPHTRINDATLGTAGNLLGAVWAHRHGTPGAAELAHRAADLLLAEGEPTEAGTNWLFVPRRFTEDGAGRARRQPDAQLVARAGRDRGLPRRRRCRARPPGPRGRRAQRRGAPRHPR